MHVTYFAGGRTDAFPSNADETGDPMFWLEGQIELAPGVDKGCNGFVCFVRMKPGTPDTLAELNNARTKAGQPLLVLEQLARGYRNYAHIAEVTAIGIDYDEYPTEPPDWRPESWPCDVYAHSTHNYHPAERPGKWRAILPLKTPIPIEREPQVRKALQAVLPRGCILRAPHQPAFLPTCPEGSAVELRLVKQTDVPGGLDWTRLIDMTAPVVFVYADGEAASTILGAEFHARGLVSADRGNKLDVVCPWAGEHVSGGDLGYLYVTDDGLGKYGCAHGACKGRGSPDVYELWGLGGDTLPKAEEGAQEPPRVEGGRFVRGPELALEQPPPDWLIEGLEICPGRPPLLTADPSAGKTWSLQSIALSVAHGLPVFERFPCRKGPVLHVSLDSGLAATKRRYQKLARGMGVSLEATDIAVFPHRVILTDARGTFQRKGLKEINDEVARGGYVLVILDSLSAICAGLDENSTEIAEPLAATKDESCVWWWAHHNAKNGGYRGSSAIRAAAGAHWTLTTAGDNRRWENVKPSEDHDGGALEPFETEWIVDGSGARIVAVDASDIHGDSEANEVQKAQWEMLHLLTVRGSASYTDLLGVAGAVPGVKGRVRRRAIAVLTTMANPATGLICNVSGEKYVLAPGVLCPRAPNFMAALVKSGEVSETAKRVRT